MRPIGQLEGDESDLGRRSAWKSLLEKARTTRSAELRTRTGACVNHYGCLGARILSSSNGSGRSHFTAGRETTAICVYNNEQFKQLKLVQRNAVRAARSLHSPRDFLSFFKNIQSTSIPVESLNLIEEAAPVRRRCAVVFLILFEMQSEKKTDRGQSRAEVFVHSEAFLLVIARKDGRIFSAHFSSCFDRRLGQTVESQVMELFQSSTSQLERSTVKNALCCSVGIGIGEKLMLVKLVLDQPVGPSEDVEILDRFSQFSLNEFFDPVDHLDDMMNVELRTE